MLLFTSSSIEHILTYDETYEQLKLKGKLEIMLGLTGNEQINKHWIEIGKSVCDFVLYINCIIDESECTDESMPIKVYGNLSFKKNSDASGGATANMKSKSFEKLLLSLNRPISQVVIPLSELGTNYTQSEEDSFDCKIQMSIFQISLKLN